MVAPPGPAPAGPARSLGLAGDPDVLAALAEAAAASGVRVRRLAPGSDPAPLAACDLVVVALADDDDDGALLDAVAAAAPGAALAVHAPDRSVTGLAAATAATGRVVGLHLHTDGLVEVVAGLRSGPRALALVAATAEALGLRVVLAADGPGALVARCARSPALEALALLEEGLAAPEQIDRIARAAGLAEGPFERLDRVGVDAHVAGAERAFAAAYGLARWRPSPLAARMAAAGLNGASTGRGFYAWAEGRPLRPEDPAPPAPGGGDRRLIVVRGDLAVAHELRLLADEADWRVEEEPGGDVPWLIVEAGDGADEAGRVAQGAHQVLLCARGSLHELDPGGTSVGFHALPPLGPGAPVELTRQPRTPDGAAARAEALFGSLGLAVAWVGDAPGLVLGRIVAQLVNEAAWALTQGVTEDRIALDEALEAAAGLPLGPLAWGDEIGLDHVLAVLDALRDEVGGERYRAAPLLRRLVADDRLGMAAGEGFHAYADPDG